MDTDPMLQKRFLNFVYADRGEIHVILDGDCSCDTCTLSSNCATHHTSNSSVRYFVSSDTTPNNQEVLDPLRD